MPDVAGRRRAVAVALLVPALLLAIAPSIAQASSPPGLERFLDALGQVESRGSYTAHNETSGAYGKYQIMPASWAAWAKAYLGSSTAPQTPANQEIVAHRKVTALYNWLDAWPTVAHWWLTGSAERSASLWSSFSRTYVDRVMSIYRATGDVTGASTTRVRVASSSSWISTDDARIGETSRAITYRLGWSTAAYAAYSGHRVKYATRAGASATVSFSGNGIAWMGPVGPTRGTARIFIDGHAVANINLHRSTFQARALLFARKLTAGQHVLKIVVTSSGRPVAIDNLIVGR